MTQKQDAAISQLKAYMRESNLELLEKREIGYGIQFRISDGTDVCTMNIYTSGKLVVGGKKTPLRQRLEEWRNLLQASLQMSPVEHGDTSASLNRATKFIVAQAKIAKVKSSIAEIPGMITWREGGPAEAQVYQAEIRADGDKVVVTQYRTGTLMVQGRASAHFDEVCDWLDQRLSQSVADRATRYIPEGDRQAALEHLCRPDAETTALAWLTGQLGEDVFDFLYPHDRETLLSGAALLQTVETIDLHLPDYSVLVMPFARAYEGFLVKLSVHIGLGDEKEIEQNLGAIKVGHWLDKLPELIVDRRRHGHIVDELKAAWTGSRCLAMHSDPARRTKMSSLGEAQNEICGVLVRAFERGFHSFVKEPIELKQKDDTGESEAHAQPAKRRKKQIEVEGIDEPLLLERLEAAGYALEYFDDPGYATKWRAGGEHWKVFCLREPGDKIVVRGTEQESFMAWFHGETKTTAQPATASPRIESHIGVDEAGKGDYFGPLTVAAVYVTEDSALDLIRWGVRDSKDISDSVIADLALRVRESCPHVEIVLMPPAYNAAYQEHQNLNSLLADLHARAIEALVEQTNCNRVVDDQFAAAHVLEDALAERELAVDLEQRTGGEADVAVAAASILARDSFVAAIQDFRAKTEMDIPLGSSSPKVIEVGQAIVRNWGPAALERIAKLNFKTTEKIKRRR